MGIAFGSIATGLPKDIVQQIIKAEKIPVQKMEGRKDKIKAKEKLVNELHGYLTEVNGLLNANKNSKALSELKVDTNEDLIGVTIDKNIADPTNHSIEVVQLARKSSAMSSGFESRNESYVGVGYISYVLPNGESKEIYVDSDHSSLDGIASLINKDGELGLKATVVNDGNGNEKPWHLLMSVSGTGESKKATFPYFYFVDGEEDFYLEKERPAQNAIVKIDGFEVEVPENKVKDLIPGVTLDLKKAKPGEEVNLDIKQDITAVSGKFQGIIEKVNSVLKFIHKQNSLDEKTDTTKTLGGDLILQTIESRIRSSIFKEIPTSEGPRRIGDLGVTFQRDGTIALDDKKFDSFLSKNYKTGVQILTGKIENNDGKYTKSNGFINNIIDVVKTIIQRPSGVLANRKSSIKNKIKQIDRQIERKQRLIAQKETNLKNKFARLEETVSKIKSQGAGLSALGAQGSNPVTQLG